jgi:putative transposase
VPGIPGVEQEAQLASAATRPPAARTSVLPPAQRGHRGWLLRQLLASLGSEPKTIVTDKLGNYGVACRALMPKTIHSNDRYANNRAELSHQPTLARERGMRRFSSPEQAQRFLSAHAVIYNLFNLQRHLASEAFYQFRRPRAFKRWNDAVAA